MESSHQQSPPTLSPYQRALKHSPLTQSPTYPSPARSDTDSINYTPEGLGLYNYSMPLHSTGAQSNTLFPPSPQPTEAWNRLPSEASPSMNDPHGDPWALYEQPISRSPLPWNGQFSFSPSGLVGNQRSPILPQNPAISHRSSLSSSNTLPMYSRSASEAVFTPQVKLEVNSDWPLDPDSQDVLRNQPLTVSPERLSTETFPYTFTYASPPMLKYESSPDSGRTFERRRSDRSHSAGRRRVSSRKDEVTGSVPRQRVRRTPTTRDNANFSCEVCGKLFQRSYNHKTHLATHDPERPRPNHCQYKGCDREFVRKTDLLRHESSVRHPMAARNESPTKANIGPY